MRKSILLTLSMIILGPTSLIPVKAQDLVYVAVDPCRIVDTREAGGVITANNFRNFLVSGTLGELAVQGGKTDCLDPKAGTEPLAISAYVMAVPANSSTGRGVLTAYPSDRLPPPAGAGSIVNFAAGQTIGNTTNITLCDPANCPTDGEFAILARMTDEHVVIDVQGYFYPATLGICPSSAATRFVDNGDGTICDNQTGLMWEKKDAADGVEDLSNPHDVDNHYTWTSTTDGDNVNPDGTAFTDFLARLNGDAASNPDTAGIGFAGHTDWRLPNAVELQTLLFEPYPCSINPCIIDPVFIPTAEALHWSSTSDAVTPSMAWIVAFDLGGVFGYEKSFSRLVRAVRGGQ